MTAQPRQRECPRCANEISDLDDIICAVCGADIDEKSGRTLARAERKSRRLNHA